MRKAIEWVSAVLVAGVFFAALGYAQTVIIDLDNTAYVTGSVASGSYIGSGAGLSIVPSGALAYADGACPAGAEYTALRGRYLVGLNPSGVAAAVVGTALTDQENRPAGLHTHTASSPVTDGGHTHTGSSSITPSTHTHSDWSPAGFTLGAFGDGWVASGSTNTGDTALTVTTTLSTDVTSVTAGTTVNNTAGTTAGTNAPYKQLRGCLQ